MDRVRVKVCCIGSADEVRMAGDAGADWLGLVGPMPSGPGILTLPEARALAEGVSGPAQAILLTASDTASGIVDDARQAGVSAVQVVRHIAEHEARALAASGLHYAQVVHVEDRSALDQIGVYGAHCNAFLLDSGRPGEGELGGTGRVHDWTLSAEFCRRAPRPVFLAGGLTPDNVTEAVKGVRPGGVDICSGLRHGGRLDPALLGAFMAALRDAQTGDAA